jgi:hypothetical protein
MANEAAKTQTINIVPVQGIFEPEPTFDLITLIGPAGTPFFAKIDPNQSGLNITNSTINSTTIGAITPSTGVFTNIATTTGTISSTPSSPTDIVNKQYVDYFAAGLSWKQPANAASTVNIANLSGLQTVDTVSLVAGNTILVKNQTNAADNGIYVVSSGPWTRSIGADTWDEYVGAIIFIVSGTQADSAWYSTAQPGGTLGVTAINWSNFTVSAIYTAGTGLTLTGTVFSITPVGTAGTYGSASAVPVFVTNASGQVSSVTNTPIAIANTQVSGLGTMSTQNANSVAITGGTIDGTTIGGSTAAAVTGTIVTANTYFSGAGTNLTGTASGLSIGGNAATATSATSATTATNIAGGAAGSVPYQSAPSTTTFLAAGSNGQVLTLASGVPSWATPTTGTVTSVSGTGTVSGISLSGTVTSSGNLTLGGTLDLSAPPAIGGTTANTVRGTTITATTKFVGPFFEAATSAGGALRNSGGTSQLSWGAGGGDNLTLSVSTNINGTNAQIDISPTGTGHVHIKPTGVNSVEIAPTSIGTINNMSIGATTAAAGYFTTLSLTSTLAVNGSTGTNGQVLQSNGSSAPTWVTPSSYATVTDDTTTNATRYPLYADQTTGNLTTEFVSSTKLQFNPSTGVFTSTSFSGAGTGLTGTATSLSIGGNAATATSATTATNIAGGTANQIPFQTGAGATSFIVAPTVSSTALTWNGSAFTWATSSGGLTISDDTTTNATRYLTFTSATTGTITSENVSSTKLTFNPSTGNLTVPNATLSSTGALTLNVGTTAQRPGSPVVGMIRYNTTESKYEVYSGALWQPITTANYPYNVEYLVVAGGGGSGSGQGGAGGAGGLLTGYTSLSGGVQYTITIGAGGAGGAALGKNNGTQGSNTSALSLTAIGGGYGARSLTSGGSGGSGGGGGNETGFAGGAGTSGQGFAGGAASGGAPNYAPGGGGGSGGVGGAGTSTVGGNGGLGTSSTITGSTVFYASGGAAGAYGGGSVGSVSAGGGGAAGTPTGASAKNLGTNGTANTGGGAGGGSDSGAGGTEIAGATGGSGVVILSIPTANYSGTTTGSPTVTTSGSNTILKFTGSGSYTA